MQIDCFLEKIAWLHQNRSKTFKFLLKRPKKCGFWTFSDKLYHPFDSEWLFINFDELSRWKIVERSVEINCSKSNSRNIQKWLFLALFGYFWDWKCLHDNSAQLLLLKLYHNGVFCEGRYQKTQIHCVNMQKIGTWSGFWKFFSVVTRLKYFKTIIFQSHMDPPNWG